MRRVVNKAIEHHKKLTWLLIIFSVAMLFFSPLEELRKTLSETLSWVVPGLLLTEGLFVLGIFFMAASVEHELGLNPLKWRSHVRNVLRYVPQSRIFWTGFWVNAVGAVGSGVVLGVAIVVGLPVTSWGLIWLPFLDLGLTIALRAVILELKKETTLEKA